MSDVRRERAGLVFAGLCAVTAAFAAPVARLTTGRADPLFVATVTTILAGVVAAAVLAARGQLGELVRGSRTGLLIALGALGTLIPNVFFFVGTARTSAIEAVLCLQIEPVYSLLLAWLALGHRPSRRRVLSVGILLAGVVLAVAGKPAADPLGLALLLATPASWQLSHLLVLRRLEGLAPEILTGARYVWGGLLLAVVAGVLLGRERVPAPAALAGQLPVLALQGVVLYYAGTVLWYQAIARLDLARATAIVVPSVPLLSLCVGFLLLGERPTGTQLAGMGLTAAGVLSFVLAPHADRSRPDLSAPTSGARRDRPAS